MDLDHLGATASAAPAVGAAADRSAAPDAALLDAADLDAALRTISFEELVRRRLRPVIATLADGSDAGSIFRAVVAQVEGALIDLALERTGGNQQRAARLLGIGRNTLRSKHERAAKTGRGARGNGDRP